jgi:hypothetical protein
MSRPAGKSFAQFINKIQAHKKQENILIDEHFKQKLRVSLLAKIEEETGSKKIGFLEMLLKWRNQVSFVAVFFLMVATVYGLSRIPLNFKKDVSVPTVNTSKTQVKVTPPPEDKSIQTPAPSTQVDPKIDTVQPAPKSTPTEPPKQQQQVTPPPAQQSQPVTPQPVQTSPVQEPQTSPPSSEFSTSLKKLSTPENAAVDKEQSGGLTQDSATTLPDQNTVAPPAAMSLPIQTSPASPAPSTSLQTENKLQLNLNSWKLSYLSRLSNEQRSLFESEILPQLKKLEKNVVSLTVSLEKGKIAVTLKFSDGTTKKYLYTIKYPSHSYVLPSSSSETFILKYDIVPMHRFQYTRTNP